MRVGVRAEIPRTRVGHWPQSSYARDVTDAEIVTTIWLHAPKAAAIDRTRAQALGATPPRSRQYENRGALHGETDTDAARVERVTAYCERFGLETLATHWRSMTVRGPISEFAKAFGADVSVYVDAEGRPFRSRSGSLSAEPEIAGIVQGIFGFSQWPRAHRLGALQRHADPLTVADITTRYAFPDATGAGQTVGIVQMGGECKLDDFAACMKAQSIEREPPVVKRIDDPADEHVRVTTQDFEGALDAQIIGALAPAARIIVYRGPDSERAFLDAVRTAIFDTQHAPSILSISYGWPEYLWTPAAIDILDELFAAAALLGMSVFCASGDNGVELDYDGKPHVLFPASSPFVHACGATSIVQANESAWEHTGGGFSEHFPVPQWQSAANGRGLPDVCAQESPGYCVYLDGVELAAGGTSAVAPLWAALTARLNEHLGASLGFFAPLLYTAHDAAFTSVTEGGNGYYEAGQGWNPCTGLGVPIGTGIASLFA